MSMLCKVMGHKWNHCKCARCGAKRNEEHVWDGCECTVCGTHRNQDHQFKVIPNGHYKFELRYDYTGHTKLLDTHTLKCGKCGKTVCEKHQWTGSGCMTKCSVCEAMPIHYDTVYYSFDPDISHQWTGSTCRDTCRLCGSKYPNGHQWTGKTCMDQCKLCGARNPNGEHDYEELETTRTSYGTKVGRFRCRYCGREYTAPYDFSSTDSV